MGFGNFNVEKYNIKAKQAQKTKNSGFTANKICDEFDPAKVNTRFSRRGPFNDFRDVITVLIGLDVTGSMGKIPKALLTGGLGSLMVDLQKKFNRPNENIQLCFGGIGDGKPGVDDAPWQAGHFESDIRVANQLSKLWLEGGGGGNGGESYHYVWYYAANKTHLNYVEQDKRKGILITIGDDKVHPVLTAYEIKKWLDPQYEGVDIKNKVLLKAVRAQYHVYHIVVTDGGAYRNSTTTHWTDLLDSEHVIPTKSNAVHLAIADIVKRHRPRQRASMANLTEKEWKIQNIKNLTDRQWQQVLRYTLCPLTRQFMDNPVVWGGSKRAYEKRAVIDYVGKYRKDPRTHEPLTENLRLKPTVNIDQLCEYYRPFFDALSDDRKRELVQLTLPPIPMPVEHQETGKGKGKSLVAAGPAFFPQGKQKSLVESDQAAKALEKVESNLECPLTHELFIDPVLLGDTGHTFERTAIEEWLQKKHTDPLSNDELENIALVPNYTVKGLCDDVRAKEHAKETEDSTTLSS